jgi:hypothetical protein
VLDNLSYLAGLLDGEGCIGYHSGGNGVKKRFVIEVHMTCENIIDWLKQNYGGSKRRRDKSTMPLANFDQYVWRIKDKAAKLLYQEVKPYLKLKNTITL